jgi:outer membrane protein insertion porin family
MNHATLRFMASFRNMLKCMDNKSKLWTSGFGRFWLIKRIGITLMIFSALFILNNALPSSAVIIGPPPAAPKVAIPPRKVEVGPIVTAIEIRGSRTLTESDIMDAVFSRIGDVLIEEKVSSDVKAIYALGYFEDVSASFESFAKGTRIIFNVIENPVLAGISFEGNSVFGPKDLSSLMKTKVGEILNFKTLQEDISAINDHYKKNGYVLARVADVSTDPKTNILKIKMIEGVIESIALDGNSATRDYVILREIDTKPGDVLNEKSLAKDLRRVFNLGFFSELNPDFEPGSSPEKIVLVLKIKEAKTNTVNFGGGYGEREGWFGFVDTSLNNLFGTGHGTMVRAQWGSTLTTYQLKYYYPWFMTDYLGPRTSMTYRVWNTAGPDIYGNEIRDAMRVGWDIALSRPFREYFSHSLSFGSETVLPREDSTITDAVTFEPYVSDFVGYSISYDTRDFWMNPSEGKFYTVSVRKGWKKTNVTTNYTKLGLDMNEFIKLAPSQVLALHMGAGVGYGDIPLGELYWCGGANTVRGYFPSEAVLGTRKLIFNMEYRYTFNEIFQGVAFYDFGNAWGEVLDSSATGGAPDFSRFLSGRGMGLRLNTPLGPIRLDYGIGDSRAFGEGIVHFSIGQAF